MMAALALAGCGAANDAGGDGDYMDDDLPMGNCSAGSGGACPADSGNVPAGFPCGASQDCEGDLTCVAPFADDEVGEFTCSAQCIPLEDEAWWCLDASACCDVDAVCSPRGLCLLPGALDDTAGDAASSTIGDASISGTAGTETSGGDASSTGGSGGASTSGTTGAGASTGTTGGT